MPSSQQTALFSEKLQRTVQLTLVRTPNPLNLPQSVLLVFDGQDFPTLEAEKAMRTSERYFSENPLLLVGIHANQDRLLEYGTASQPDYAQRGIRARQTTEFVLSELIPYLKTTYPIATDRSQWAIAGFSLGGLMALDIAWHHAAVFSKVGVFSGSFWWRQRALDQGYTDQDRIMHSIVQKTRKVPALSFWFQTGTHDEMDDRDGDGVIDSIADTLDLIAELERKGYSWGREIRYVEIEKGEHHPTTWAKVFPQLIRWCQHTGSDILNLN